MGWLFAVALGLHRRNGAVVLLSLLPIALGHAAAIAIVIFAVLALGVVVDHTMLSRTAGGDPDRLGNLARRLRSSPTPARGHADRPRRPRAVVVPDGQCPRRGSDADPGADASVSVRLACNAGWERTDCNSGDRGPHPRHAGGDRDRLADRLRGWGLRFSAPLGSTST
jgi:hypothetical protein